MRTILVILAVLAACLAQALVGDAAFRNVGWIIYIAASILFAILCKNLVTVRIAGDRLNDPMPLNPVPRSRFFRAAMTASAGVNIAALVSFAISETSGLGWGLYTLSICLFLLGVSLDSAQTTLSVWRGTARINLKRFAKPGLLALILLFAFVVRVWQLDVLPAGLWIDEALVGLTGERVLTDPEYRPLYELKINRPLHIAYLTAGSFALFGRTVAAIRLVTAIFGVLSVLAAYLLFDRLLGNRIQAGLIAAVIVAVMRYDLTFSRVAFDGITVPWFIMLILYLLDYGFEHKKVSAFALTGLCLGLGLAFYQPMLIFTFILIGLGVGVLIKALWFSQGQFTHWRERWNHRIRPWLPHFMFALFGFFIAVSPLAEYALFVPSKFFRRVNTASIVAEAEEPPLLAGLWINTTRQLGMFHAEGDHNGRHNLPGAPMLDPAMGVLFALGAGIAFSRWRESPFVMALIILAGMLAAGVFSASSTTPHALRAVGAIPVVVFLALIALISLMREAERLLARFPVWRQTVIGAASVCLLIVIGVSNLDTYFNRQMSDADVIIGHSMAETWIAAEMNRLEATHDFLVSLHFWNSPTIQFLAPNISNLKRLWGTEPLPLKVDTNRPLVLFLDPTMDEFLDKLRYVYPGCMVVNLTPSDEAHVVARGVYLSVEVLRASRLP